MATILIVDDRPTNREVLITLLGYKGHRLLEASDGAEGLTVARAGRPDLIITDILMPTMDGYEFVRQLRLEPGLTQTPIIFYTAHYHEQAAQALAQACGVNHILAKPSKPRVILQTVEEALGFVRSPTSPPAETFDREHLQLLTDKLSSKNEELRLVNSRLSTLVDINLQLASERDPRCLLQIFCHAARELMGARFATVSILPEDEPGQRHFFASGLAAEVAAGLEAVPPQMDPPALLGAQRRPYHLRNYSGDPEMAGFPPAYPPFDVLLVAPIVSPSQVYGWFCLFDKVGAEEFTAADEHLATLLTTMLGRVYENRHLYAEIQGRSKELEQEVAERKRAEEALRESEEKLRLFVEHAPAALAMFDRDMRYLAFSRRWIADYRLDDQDIAGQSHYDVFPEIPDRWREVHRRGLKGEVIQVDEDYFVRTDGAVQWLRWEVRPWIINTGSIGGIVIFTEDITERKQAERELHYQATLLRSISDAIITTDLGFMIQTWNSTAEALYGWQAEEVLGKQMGEVIPTSYPTYRPEAVVEQFQAEGKWQGEAIQKHKNGHNIYVLASVTMVRDEAGQPISVLAINRDITQRKRAEEALLVSEEKLRTLFALLPVGVTILNQERQILEVNPTVERVLGFSRQDLLAGSYTQRKYYRSDGAPLPPDEFPSALAIKEQREVLDVDIGMLKDDGEKIWLSVSAIPLTFSDWQVAIIVVDITERKQAEEELRQTATELARSNTELEQFAYVASHDLQEPLRAVAGTVQLLQQRYAGRLDARADELIQHAVEGASRMQTLINDLLIFSRVATRGQPFQPSDCAAILTNVQANLSVAIRESGAVITHDPLPRVMADPTQLTQLFQNLIANAVKFRGDEAPAIHIGVQPTQDEYLFTVCDNGIGMEAQYFERIFAIFQRLHTRREYAGTGIGLALCKKIVERHGGRIWVESQPGQGSTFYFTLPDRHYPEPAAKPS